MCTINGMTFRVEPCTYICVCVCVCVCRYVDATGKRYNEIKASSMWAVCTFGVGPVRTKVKLAPLPSQYRALSKFVLRRRTDPFLCRYVLHVFQLSGSYNVAFGIWERRWLPSVLEAMTGRLVPADCPGIPTTFVGMTSRLCPLSSEDKNDTGDRNQVSS